MLSQHHWVQGCWVKTRRKDRSYLLHKSDIKAGLFIIFNVKSTSVSNILVLNNNGKYLRQSLSLSPPQFSSIQSMQCIKKKPGDQEQQGKWQGEDGTQEVLGTPQLQHQNDDWPHGPGGQGWGGWLLCFASYLALDDPDFTPPTPKGFTFVRLFLRLP